MLTNLNPGLMEEESVVDSITRPKIVLIGCNTFSKQIVDYIVSAEIGEIIGIVTSPRIYFVGIQSEPVVNVNHFDFHTDNSVSHIPIETIQYTMHDSSIAERFFKLGADLFLVAGWYHIVPSGWRKLLPAYGLHASLLPDYAGHAPLVWALINGEERTGVTLFELDDGVDTGPIIAQLPIDIEIQDDIATLIEKMTKASCQLLSQALPDILRKRPSSSKSLGQLHRTFPARRPQHGVIDWAQTVIEVRNFIRAQTRPYPGAFMQFNEITIRIWSAEETINCSKPPNPGSVYSENDRLYVSATDGWLHIANFALEGTDISEQEFLQSISAASNHSTQL